jgi:hypothetical protein
MDDEWSESMPYGKFLILTSGKRNCIVIDTLEPFGGLEPERVFYDPQVFGDYPHMFVRRLDPLLDLAGQRVPTPPGDIPQNLSPEDRIGQNALDGTITPYGIRLS